MIREDVDMDRHVSEAIIELADELIKKLEMNDQVINERRVSNAATDRLSWEIISFLRDLISGSQDTNEGPELRISRLTDSISSMMSSLESSIRSSSEELIRLEATQDGMRRALEAVRSTGQVRIQEIEKLEALMDQEDHGKNESKVAPPTKKSRSKEIINEK
jgi:hypothetical protein